MEDPLADAETMKIDQQGNITELGKKPQSEEDIQAQYIGLFKIAKEFVSQVREFYHSLDREAKYDGKDFDNMYMTSFLQLIIDRLGAARAVPIAGGWVEIDQPSDVNIDAC